MWEWSETEPLGTAASNGPTVPATDDEWELWCYSPGKEEDAPFLFCPPKTSHGLPHN